MHHVVVISDIHLCQAVAGDGLWMRYRQRRFFPDAELARLFESLSAEARGGSLELVLNGDLFDFDALPVQNGAVRAEETPRTEHEAAAVLGRILDDHHEFVAALAQLIIDGHSLVFVSGNHDAQLAWHSVRAVLVERILAAANARASNVPEHTLRARIEFRTWFHRTDAGIHIEHGNQYDAYCSFRYPMEPFTRDRRGVQPTMGSLSFRHLAARMGYFNPHVDSSFLLSGPQYFAHWARYYIFSQHSLAGTWARGALRIASDIVRNRDPLDRARAERNLALCAEETGVDLAAIRKHASLFTPPSEDAPHLVIRELWLDRAAITAFGVAAIGLGAIGGGLLAAKLALGVAGTFAAYELALPKKAVSETYTHVEAAQREIARVHDARAIVFGHTHQPYGVWEEGVFYGNSGTWSPSYRDIECTMPIDEARPVIWLRVDEASRIEGGLYRWRDGALVPAAERGARTSGERAIEPGAAPVGTARTA